MTWPNGADIAPERLLPTVPRLISTRCFSNRPPNATAKVGQILIARAGNSRARLLILVMVLVALLAAAARAGDGLRRFVIDMLPVNMVDATGLPAPRSISSAGCTMWSRSSMSDGMTH